jgi:hypothetical protein
MASIRFTGGPQAFSMLVEQLRNEGLDPRYEPPIEHRGTGQEAMSVLIQFPNDVASGLVAVGIDRAIKAVRARHPRSEISTDLPTRNGEVSAEE